MKNYFLFLSFLGLAVIGLSGCQSNPVREFESLKIGLDKNQVLGKLGSPRSKERFSGEDRWYYTFYPDSDGPRLQKEVHFKDGLVIYFGDKKIPAPEFLPENIDVKNDHENKELIIEKEKREQASKSAYQDYLKFEKQIKKQDQVDYLPEFTPVQ